MTHTWISTESAEHVSCLTCGGTWNETEYALGSVIEVTAANGDSPSDCNPGACHHYHNEHGNEMTVCRRSSYCNCLHCG